MTEAQQLSYTLDLSVKEAKAQANVKLVKQHILDQEVNNLVEGNVSVAAEFTDSLILSQEDLGTRIDPWSHKERPEAQIIDDNVEDEEEESVEAALIWKKGKCSFDVRDTPIATPTFKSHKGVVARLSRRHHHMLQSMRQTFLHKHEVKKLASMVSNMMDDEIPSMVRHYTNEVLEGSLRQIKAEFSSMITKELATVAMTYVFSLHKIHATSFPDDDLEELLTRWAGIESYQIRVNLIAPTLTIPGIETLSLYLIITDPFIGIVYENSKKDRRVMNIDELLKFCDATLEKGLKNVREINVEARHGFKDPPLSIADQEIMVLFEEEIQERLKYRRQMRRCETYMNGRPILALKDRLE
ncbi:hypothetical protein Tco_1228287 [Tanacetum coccineum]